MLILDVGCGFSKPVLFPEADVSIDVNTPEGTIPKNFLKCDAHNLPFREKTFDEAYMHHVLEHLEYPLKCLREIKRVVKTKVVIHIPNYLILPESPEHLYSWNQYTLTNLLQQVFPKVIVRQWGHFPLFFHGSFFWIAKKSKIFLPIAWILEDWARKFAKDELHAICWC